MMQPQTIVLKDGFRVGALISTPKHPDAPSVVFFHGLTASAATYVEMLEELDELGFHVIALDAPNHGQTDTLPWGATIEDHASRMVEALEQTAGFRPVVSRFWVVGHSMGGAIALEVANQRPWHVDGVILMDAAVGETHHSAVRIDGWQKTPASALRFAAGSLLDIFGDAYLAMSLRTLRERLSFGSRLAGTVHRGAFFRSAWALMHHDSRSALLGLREHGINTHHLHGTRDHMIQPLAAADAVTLSGGKLHLIEGGFHSWMVAAPSLGRAWLDTIITQARLAA